jgi:hypothetical protein
VVELTLPVCEAQVSPELLALLRGDSWKVSATVPEPPAVTYAENTVVPVEVASGPRLAQKLDWPVVSLRRDGARPMRFPGLVVTSDSQSLDVQVAGTPVPVARHLTLYLTATGESVAHVVCIPSEDQPARPVHRAARVASAEDLAALLRAASPDTCFAVSRVAAQWEGQAENFAGPFHITRSVPPLTTRSNPCPSP